MNVFLHARPPFSVKHVITCYLKSFQLTLHAKKAAEEASKQALEASKQAAGASKNTFDDLTYVGKSTLGDLTKTAKEAAAKKGLLHQQQGQQLNQSQQQQQPSGNTIATTNQGGMLAGTGRDFFSSFTR